MDEIPAFYVFSQWFEIQLSDHPAIRATNSDLTTWDERIHFMNLSALIWSNWCLTDYLSLLLKRIVQHVSATIRRLLRVTGTISRYSFSYVHSSRVVCRNRGFSAHSLFRKTPHKRLHEAWFIHGTLLNVLDKWFLGIWRFIHVSQVRASNNSFHANRLAQKPMSRTLREACINNRFNKVIINPLSRRYCCRYHTISFFFSPAPCDKCHCRRSGMIRDCWQESWVLSERENHT